MTFLGAAEIAFDCPFCSGSVRLHDDPKRGWFIVHELPACQQFIDQEGNVFMESCRQQLRRLQGIPSMRRN